MSTGLRLHCKITPIYGVFRYVILQFRPSTEALMEVIK